MSWQDHMKVDILHFLNQQYPRIEAVEVIDWTEHIELGFGGSDVTAPDDPEIEVEFRIRDRCGGVRSVQYGASFTDLLRQLTARPEDTD